jgi:hypothetical protein
MIASLALFACLATGAIAIQCTENQKQNMLDSITKNSNWPTCVKATAPFSFYSTLIQEGPPPTKDQIQLFLDTPSCVTVYSRFQASLKAANCDEIQDLIGLKFQELIARVQRRDSTSGSGSSSTSTSSEESNDGSSDQELASAPTTIPPMTMQPKASTAAACFASGIMFTLSIAVILL